MDNLHSNFHFLLLLLNNNSFKSCTNLMILDNVTLVIELSRYNTKLTEVIIPCVTIIDIEALNSCLNITLIIIPNKLKIVILLTIIFNISNYSNSFTEISNYVLLLTNLKQIR